MKKQSTKEAATGFASAVFGNKEYIYEVGIYLDEDLYDVDEIVYFFDEGEAIEEAKSHNFANVIRHSLEAFARGNDWIGETIYDPIAD